MMFNAACHHHAIHPTTGTGQGPAFYPIAYTIDVLVPIISLGQRTNFTPTGWALICTCYSPPQAGS